MLVFREGYMSWPVPKKCLDLFFYQVEIPKCVVSLPESQNEGLGFSSLGIHIGFQYEYICMYICMNRHLKKHIYWYIHILIYIYIYMHIHIHMYCYTDIDTYNLYIFIFMFMGFTCIYPKHPSHLPKTGSFFSLPKILLAKLDTYLEP